MQFSNKISLLMVLLFSIVSLTGCPGGGGGSSNDSSNDTSSNADNQLTIRIADQVNIPMVSVTVCVPGDSSSCKTIDNILLDTGSSGLRIMKSALSSTFTQKLTAYKDASDNQLAECMQFADGYVWGPLYKADLQIAKESAADIVFQVIDDTELNVPASCSSIGVSENTVDTFGANGVLGLGNSKQDCGAYCVQYELGVYYKCPNNSCTETTLPLAKQVHNPAVFFATNNNGVVISLPAISKNGKTSVTGSVYFGIGTADNNQLGDAKIFSVDDSGLFTTIYKSKTFDQSFMDTGSNGLYFEDDEIPLCTGQLEGFYCPESRLDLTAILAAADVTNSTGASETISFGIANTEQLNNSYAAFSNLGGTVPATLSGMFDWGLPFFYGRTVFNAFEDASTPGGTGPYVAF